MMSIIPKRELQMSLLNKSASMIDTLSLTHIWHGNAKLLPGSQLGPGGIAGPVPIVSGYEYNDDYIVTVVFQGGRVFHTTFYCNSSADQTAVQIEITDTDCNCVYYKGSGVDTGCYNKG